MISGEPEPDASVRAVLVEERADELYEDAPCGYLSTAPDGTILRANRTFLTLTGYDAHALVGSKRFYDLLAPGGKIYYETHYAPLLEMQDDVREIALEIVRADRGRVPVLVNARLKRDAEGRPALIRITVFDASDRRRYERELLHARTAAESRAAAASALEHVAEGVVLLASDGTIEVLNAAASRLFEVAPADVVGTPLSSAVPGWDAIEPRIPVARGGCAPVQVLLPLAVGGRPRWISASAALAPEGIVYTLRDVTAERRLQDFRDDIVAIVSHELRTPLTGVDGAARTLVSRGDVLDDDAKQQLLHMILEQSGRLGRILDEILLTQQLDSGDVHVRRTSFAMSDVVGRVVAESGAWRRNVRRVTLAEAELVEVEGDPSLFEQALTNVLDNAMKYGPEGSEVVVRVSRHGSAGRVTVTDAGPGIAREDEESIFEKFFRVDSRQASGVGGTGLGLYITRELVLRMQGRIGIVPSDAGTTFFIDLQVAR